MRQLCQDAMSLFARFGKPDLFITFTCNPRWKDITDCLKPGEQASDCPHIVSRVFNIKLKSLIADIKGGLLGPSVCFVYTIEFQKRGLPHAHILVTLQNGNKPVDAESIDRIVCAELPNREENPRLFSIVTSTMVHGPCRGRICMVNGHCDKGFPKAFANETVVKANEYPIYRRRDMPAETVIHGNHQKTVTNAYLVPYNPVLALKYNAHINVEIVTSMRSAIKYIYKYVYKGFDVASLMFTIDRQLICNEVSNFINCRYVSAPEAMWRISEFRMHDHSHTVTRLPIHLENPTELYFDGGLEIQAEQEERTATTMLEAYFELNAMDENARRHLYAEIPEHYVFNKGQRRWNERQQRGNRIIARIHDVNMNSIERFALRVLLLNVRGAQSFAALRNVNGQMHQTFNAAAQALNLIRNDDVFLLTFDNLVTMRMPPQLRNALANMLLTFTITDGLNFWNRYKGEMIEDFRRMPQFANSTIDELYNLALHALNEHFARSGRTNATFGLPDPQGPAVILTAAQPIVNQAFADIALNPAQQHGFDRIMSAAHASRLNQQHQRTFVLIGPGGSGKTTLYRKIIDACTQRGLKARVYATTGIAATLMPGGLTVHRGFGLPLNMNEQSTSRFQQNLASAACQELAQTNVFLIDEVTMMVKHGVNIIDKLLRAIMKVNQPFGGKVIVFGGDFRQLLPVVPRGTRANIVAESVLASNEWKHCEVISLNQNMRAHGDPLFAEWLLKLGTGSLPIVIPGERNTIEIPEAMLLQIPPQPPAALNNINIPRELEAMIEKVFGDDINNLTQQQLTSRSILCTNLKEVMIVNNIMIASLNGNARTYFSVDEIISTDLNDQHNFPPEYLNGKMPSGIPPHELNLKVGAVIMLIRNLDPEKGLSNGTRLIVTELLDNAIVAKIISESHQGDIVFIFRMDLVSEDTMMPVKMKRQQFPVIPAYAMTINKSQGQSIENLGIYLNDVVFSHGQLYVALSRSRDSRNISVFIRDQGTRQGHLMRNIAGQQHRVFTRNVVYREVFQHGELPTIPNIEELDPDMVHAINMEIMEMEDDDLMANIQIPGEFLEQDAEEEQYPALNVALTDEEDDQEDQIYTPWEARE